MTNNIQNLEKTLYAAADKMRNSLEVSEYKYVVLGLIFLKYISEGFEERYEEVKAEGYGLENERDSYIAENVFYVPEEARWSYISAHSKDPKIGEILDKAMDAVEKENPTLKGVLFKVYNDPDKRNVRLGEIIDLFTNETQKIGTKEAKERDTLGRIYEYFLGEFAAKDGKKGGEFYTPACLVQTMVAMIEPYKGRVYDPACGSGGMFVQSINFIRQHQGNIRDISIYGQENNPVTWKLAKMNLAIRSIEADLGKFAADTFTEDLHKDLKADFILANPPFNVSDWSQEKLLDDPRWKYGIPPKGNANYGWIEHMVSKLSVNGKAAIILASGSVSAGGQEAEIRKKLIEADLVDCIISMPTKLFYTVQVPCVIWILNRSKKQLGKTLFINATNMGHLVSRKLRELSQEDIDKLSSTYHNFQNGENYEDVAGFCKVANLDEIKANDYVLTPGRYTGVAETEEDDETFEEKMKELTANLAEDFQRSHELEEKIKQNLRAIGYEI